LPVGSNGRKRAGCIESAIAEELEEVAVQRVGSRLGHGIDGGAGVHALVGGEAAGGDLKFLQRVRKRKRQAAVIADIVVHGAVEGVRDAREHAACDRDLHTALEALGRRSTGLERGAGQDDEVGDLASLQRQRHNPLLLDDLTDAGAAHVHQGCGGFDRNGLLQIAYPQHRIDGRRGAHLEHDPGLHVGAKSL
jgi:hypothetical protein